ncbi:hypothetical protein EUTSA_v10010996mg, partial [Eutrema salsugineum]
KILSKKTIPPILNQKHGCTKTYQHYQNRMKILKVKYLSGIELLHNTSRFGWDPIIKRFMASDEAHPSYKKFHDKTFNEFDDLKVILKNNIATGGIVIGLGEDTSARTKKLPLRKRRRSNTINSRKRITKKKNEERLNKENLKKKKNNLWEAIKEVSDLEENISYDVVKVIHQLGMKDVFASMSTDER